MSKDTVQRPAMPSQARLYFRSLVRDTTQRTTKRIFGIIWKWIVHRSYGRHYRGDMGGLELIGPTVGNTVGTKGCCCGSGIELSAHLGPKIPSQPAVSPDY